MRLAVDVAKYHQLRWILGIALLAIAGIPTAVGIIYKPAPPGSVSSAEGGRLGAGLPITATGRIQPRDGVLTLAAPASAETGPAIVTALHVKQGDWVHKGDMLATLRGRTELEAALVGRQRNVALAQARLTALKAGGKEDDLNALRAEVRREEATLALAQSQTDRSRQLHQTGLVSQEALDAQESKQVVAAQTLDATRARLHALSSVRPADVAVAEAELRSADAGVEEIRARLESSLVRAPFDGRVLAIYAHPGQAVGLEGLLAFGRTSEMFVDAEVTEEDLPRAQVGQKVQITGDMLPGTINGTVEEVGSLVGSREVFRNDPTAFADSRIVHVKIRAEQPQVLARFINARVTASIQASSTPR